MATVIPGALADYLTNEPSLDLDTRDALDAARRGRGRTLIIKPRSVAVLHTISRAAERLLDTPGTTRTQRTAARTWLDRAGHAPAPAPVATNAFEQGAAGLLDEPRPGRYTLRVCEDPRDVCERGLCRTTSTRASGTLDEVRAAAAMFRHAWPVDEHGAPVPDDDQVDAEARLDAVEAEADAQFSRAARAADAVEHAEQVGARVETVEDAEALYAVQLVTESEATDGTWRGAWIGEHQADDVLFVVDGTVEQGALFRTE